MSRPVSLVTSPNGITDDLIHENELASLINRTPRTVKRWRAQRIGPPYIQLGGSVYYRRDAVRKWILSLEREQPRAKKRS